MAWLTDILVDSGNGLLSTDLMFSYIKEVYGHVAREQTSRACNLFCPISYLFLGINVYSDLTLINRSPHPTATSTRREMSRNVEKCRVLSIFFRIFSKSLLGGPINVELHQILRHFKTFYVIVRHFM